MAYEWTTGKVATVKFDVATNADGNFAGTDDTVTGKKTVSLSGIKADATFNQADTVYNEIIGKIGGANYDKKTGAKTITVTAVATE